VARRGGARGKTDQWDKTVTRVYARSKLYFNIGAKSTILRPLKKKKKCFTKKKTFKKTNSATKYNG